MLCVPRQLAELLKLPLQEVIEDFNSICPATGSSGASPPQRSGPAVCGATRPCSTWIAEAGCWIASSQRRRRRGPLRLLPGTATPSSTRAPGPCPAATKRSSGNASAGSSGTIPCRSLRTGKPGRESSPRATSTPKTFGGSGRSCWRRHQLKVSMRGLCKWSALRRVHGGPDCVIRELCEDAPVLQQWTERLGVPYRGQRLAGASLEVFLHLAGAARRHPEPPGGAAGTAAGHVQALRRAHRSGNLRDRSRHPGLPVLFGAAAGAAGAVPGVPPHQDEPGRQPQHHPPLLSLRLPELRRNAQAPAAGLPAAAAHLLPPGGGQAGGPHVGGPALRPPQGRAGSVALRGQELVRQARLRLLAGSGAGAVAALQVEPRRLPGAGFGAHGAELAGGRGALRQTFTDAAGEKEWDHVFVTELLSNSSYRPVHDYIMGAEYVAVVRIRQALAEVPRRYLKCIKTDCLVSPRSAGPPWSGCCRCRTGTARPSIATRRSPA